MNKIDFQCATCGRPMSVPESAAGKRGTCKNCNAVIVVPHESTAPTALIREKAQPLAPIKPQKIVVLREVDNEPDTSQVRVPPVPYQHPQQPQLQPQISFAPIIQQHTHVHVGATASPRSIGCVAASSVVCAVVALLCSWIPFLGLLCIPLAGLAFLLGIVGAISAVASGGGGLRASMAGICLSSFAVVVSIISTASVSHTVNQARQAAREQVANRQPVAAQQFVEQPAAQDKPQLQPMPQVQPETQPDPIIEEQKATAKTEESAPTDKEKSAAAKLKLAKGLLSANKTAAVKRLKELVDQFGDTPAATEAKEILDKLGK